MITETQKLDEAQKEAIVEAAKAYKRKFATIDNPDGLSNANLAKMANNMSGAYMSALMNGNWNSMQAAGTTVAIKDMYFRNLARAIDFKIERVFWKHFDLANYNACMNAFDDAMISKKPVCIVGKTGSGKSYSIDRFIHSNPHGTFRIDLDSDMTKNSFLCELAKVVGVNVVGTAYQMRKAIETKLMKEPNAKLIIDEGENAKKKDAIFGSIKAIIDALKGICPVILVGTPDLKKHIEDKAAKQITPFHQLERRINEGVGFVELFDQDSKEVENMCKDMGIVNPDCIDQISFRVRNTGELSGAIEKLLREIEESGEQLTAELIEDLL